MTKTEQAWKTEALKTMAHAADVLGEYERLLRTMTEQAKAYRTTRPLTLRLLHHWTGAEHALKQLNRHLPRHHARALKRLRKLVPMRTPDAERL
jgi:hypothetical protein